MSSASSSDAYPTGHYHPEQFSGKDGENAKHPPLTLCPGDTGITRRDSDGITREESKLVGLYAVVLFSGVIFFSGLGVMLSEDIPRWFVNAEQTIKTDNTASFTPNHAAFALTDGAVLSEPKHENSIHSAYANKAIAFPKLPRQFEPVWSQHALDKEHHPITILTLKKPFRLSQTARQSGLEYFTYNAYLLRQIAAQMQDGPLQQKLSELGNLSDAMAVNLEQALYSEFNGVPDSNLSHLQAKEKAKQSLKNLNANPMEISSSDRNGNVIQRQSAYRKTSFKAGHTLQAYQSILKDAIHSPVMRQEYPDTAALLISQGNRLQKISRHLSLQWESRFSCLKAACQKEPNNARIHSMRIYVKQSLRDGNV